MKKLIFYLFIVILFLVPTFVYAADLEVTGNSVRIRKGPATTYDEIKQVNKGSVYPLISSNIVADEAKNGLCDVGWYNVNYDGKSSYICATYGKVINQNDTISDVTKSACEQELKDKGFPSEYWESLCKLKTTHPTWTFNAVQTGLNFPSAVEKESACGKNSISTSGTSADYIDSSCTKSSDTGYSWASSTAVAYYMNPLNFLTEKYIFMFESNYANTTISDASYAVIVQNFLKSYISHGLATLDTAMAEAGRENNVNQVMLSARIIQELGSTGLATTGAYSGQLLSCISGEYTTRWNIFYDNGASMNNYYNFFNVGVNDGSNKGAAEKAVRYAYTHDWGGTGDQKTDLKKAIGGGANFLKTKYLDKGQYTVYAQKFNVHPNSDYSKNIYTNQYMTNLKAPQSESYIAYTKYKNNNLLESNFVFYIPIYSNLDAPIINTSNGASGGSGINTANGLDVPSVITSAGFKISGSTITGIKGGTSLDQFKGSINAIGGTVTSSSNILGTGVVVSVSNGESQVNYTIVVKGDTSGDGVINALDLLQVQKNILGQYELKDAYNLAGDTSGDGVINALDLLQIQKSILGQYEIN